MKCALALGILGGLLVAGGGCSDDATPVDTGPQPDVTLADLGGDAPGDQGLDAKGDSGQDQAVDAPASDAGADLPPADVGQPDLPVADMGPFNLSGIITRSVAPVLDAKGDIHVGLSIFPPPAVFKLAGIVIKGAHLPSTSTQVSYAMNAPPGTYWIYAFLDDNSNVTTFPPPAPDAVDLASSKVLQIKVVAGQPLKVDIVLDTLGGFAITDGGVVTPTALKGTVKASVSPVLDGKGKLMVSLHSQLPPKGQVAQSALNNADLSSPFALEMYYLGNLSAGQYYLRVFLDDNNNANPFALAPDKGDLVHSSAIQVHVLNGTINTHDVVLDQVQP